MKVCEIHTHISVAFGKRKKEMRHFNKKAVKAIKDLDMELIPNIGIRVFSPEDSVIIPFLNITAFRVEEAEPEVAPEPTEAEKKVLGFEDELEDESEDEPEDELEDELED